MSDNSIYNWDYTKMIEALNTSQIDNKLRNEMAMMSCANLRNSSLCHNIYKEPTIGLNTFSDEIAQENYDLRIENANLKRSVKILHIVNAMSFISVVLLFLKVILK